MPMIHVPRKLVRQCATELATASKLAKTDRWKRRPCKSLKYLIVGLNSIDRDFRSIASTVTRNISAAEYNYGFPQPSVAIRELEGLRGLAGRKNPAAAIERLETLIERDRDSYHLLRFRAARLCDPKTVPALHDGRALVLLRDIARNQPEQLIKFIDQVLEGLKDQLKEGRGGNRNRGDLVRRELMERLGILYHDLTGRAPAVSINRYHKSGEPKYYGRFAPFVHAVSAHLRIPINGAEARHFLRTMKDIPGRRGSGDRLKRT